MAARNSHFYYVFTIVICASFHISDADRRFSDLKRCADEECSSEYQDHTVTSYYQDADHKTLVLLTS